MVHHFAQGLFDTLTAGIGDQTNDPPVRTDALTPKPPPPREQQQQQQQ